MNRDKFVARIRRLYRVAQPIIPDHLNETVLARAANVTVRTSVGNWTMRVPRSSSPYYGNDYEPITSAWLRRAAAQTGGPALDVGAHIGYYSLLLSEALGPHGRVFAVEPVRS